MLVIKNNFIKMLISVFILIFTFVSVSLATYSETDKNICKTKTCDLKKSTPEKQGIDSKYLIDMYNSIKENETSIHSILIVKNGYLVNETYFNPYNKKIKHALYSATKSITSTLIGIAIEEGYIESVDQKVLDYFPDIEIEKDEYGAKDMTISDLLSMRTGHVKDSDSAISNTDNFPEAFFNFPFDSKPGTKYLYESGASHMLSIILTEATGLSAEDYAIKHLFKPMNITNYIWEKDSSGYSRGGGGVYLKPIDMAKFGYLSLKMGNWNGKQIVPEEWIKLATKKHTETYGYQWWINPFGGYRARGFGGQNIFVVPEKDLVVVITSGINYTETMQPNNYVNDFIIPSVKSHKSLPNNCKSLKKLYKITKSLQYPKPVIPIKYPEITKKISNKVYKFNTLNIKLSFDFNKYRTAILNIEQNGTIHKLHVGLDGIYRTTPATNVGTILYYPLYTKVSLKGQWISNDTFILDLHYLGEPFSSKYICKFNEKDLSIKITDYLHGFTSPAYSGETVEGSYE